MDRRGMVLWAVLIVVTVVLSHGLQSDRMTIGVVTDGNVTIPDTKFFQHYYDNVVFVWISVDTDEIFHVYNAVHQLDENPSIDVIVHTDVSQASIRLSDLLKARYKPLIRWGIKRQQDVSVKKDDPFEGDIVLTSRGNSQLYCAPRTDTPSERNITVLDSYIDVVPGSVTKLLVRLKWNYVIVIHDTKSEHDVSKLIDQFSTNKIMMIVINIDDVAKLEDVIFKVYQDYVKYAKRLQFLVVCRYECARKVALLANTFDDDSSTWNQKTLLKQFSMWLYVLYGFENWMSRGIRTCADDLDNVAIIAIPEWQGESTQALVPTLETAMLSNVKRMQIDGSLNTSTWKKNIIIDLIQAATSRHPSVCCNAFYIDTLLWAANDKRSFTNVGFIDMTGKILANSEVFPNTNYGYSGRTFLVSTLDYTPFVMSNISVNGTKTYYGLCMDLLSELAISLNFTYVLTEPADGKWGTYDDPEKEIYNGLIGQLQNMDVDIVAAPITMQRDRALKMDFTYPFFFEVTKIMTKRTNPMERKWRTLINPFKWHVHVSIVVSLFLVTSLLWVIEKWNPFYTTAQNAVPGQQDGGLRYWHNSFWYMYGALLYQGGIHLPGSVAGRTLVSCWWLFCIIVVGTYCGNLIAFLTVTKDKPPFSTLQEMVDRKDEYTWGTIGATHWETLFIYTSKAPLFKDVGRGIVEFNQTDPSVLSFNVAEHIKKVMQGRYAWIGDKTSMEFAMATDCDLVTSTDEFLVMSYAFGFQKNSPHSVIFADEMLKIHESGLLKIWKRKWWPKSNFCEKDRIMTHTQPISLPDVQSAFYVCFVGICLGLIALLLEIVIFKYKTYIR